MYKEYRDRREKGLVEVVRAGSVGFAMIEKRFDVRTGDEDSPDTISISESEIKRRRDALLEEIAELDAITDDIGKRSKEPKPLYRMTT